MDKRRFRIILNVLNEVKAQFPKTKEFIEESLEQECSKENISMKKIIFFLHALKQKVSSAKCFSFCSARF